MPLSDPAPRKHLHTRTVEMNGYIREDGLWDIEGRLVDTKPYAFPNDFRGRIEAFEPLHDMNVRLTVDDRFEIREVDVAMDSTPYGMCPAVEPNFKSLVGHRIGPGWRRKLKELVGGVKGCTHILELLGAMATTAYQATYTSEKMTGKAHEKNPGAAGRFLVNTCHTYRADGPVIEKYFPDVFSGGKDAGE